MPKIATILKGFFERRGVSLSMIGSHFVLKTMILIFSIPLISQSGIKVDFQPVKQFISSQQVQPIDNAQIQVAVESLAVTAQINEGISQAAQPQATFQTASAPQQDAQLAAIMQNLQKLTAQVQ